MIPAEFDYKVPATLDEAVALLASDLDGAKVLAGGKRPEGAEYDPDLLRDGDHAAKMLSREILGFKAL